MSDQAELERYERPADITELMSGEPLEVLTTGSDEAFVELADSLDVEEKSDAVAVLSHLSRSSSLRAGYLLYQIRQEVPDGEWGRKVWEFAETYQVSQRTISRWMVAAQEYFGFELTPAQRNARAAAPPTDRPPEGPRGPGDEGGSDEFENPFDGLDMDPDGDGWDDDRSLLERMNDEAGWGDPSLPQPERGTPPDAEPQAPRVPAVDPDPTWLEFVGESIRHEHQDAEYSDQSLRRMATARWSSKIEEDPQDLLEELEMIYEARGEEVPDSVAEALHEAEQRRQEAADAVLVPDEVTPGGKKKRASAGRKLAYDRAEKLLQLCRQLHEEVAVGLREHAIEDKEVAAMLPHLQSIPHTIKSLKDMAEEAKRRHLAANPPASERIAETQAEEADA